MRIKQGFCCDQFRLDYEHGTSNVVKVPTFNEPFFTLGGLFKWRDLCYYCGRDQSRFDRLLPVREGLNS